MIQGYEIDHVVTDDPDGDYQDLVVNQAEDDEWSKNTDVLDLPIRPPAPVLVHDPGPDPEAPAMPRAVTRPYQAGSTTVVLRLP